MCCMLSLSLFLFLARALSLSLSHTHSYTPTHTHLYTCTHTGGWKMAEVLGLIVGAHNTCVTLGIRRGVRRRRRIACLSHLCKTLCKMNVTTNFTIGNDCTFLVFENFCRIRFFVRPFSDMLQEGKQEEGGWGVEEEEEEEIFYQKWIP